MLTVSLPAAATHNSFGSHFYISEADEVELSEDGDQHEVGDLTPDITDDDYKITFHDNLEEDGLPARQDPADQQGLRYDGAKCQAWAESEDAADYESALREGSGCYIGFFDHQLEYHLLLSPLVTECPCDLLYPANPAEDDRYCRGEEDTSNRSISEPSRVPDHPGPTLDEASDTIIVGEDSAADEALTSASRRDDTRCDDNQDRSFLPGGVKVDLDLLETGITAAHEATGTGAGSGTWTLPLSTEPYLYVFGQPHPDTAEENRSSFRAGEGPFGPNPAELGSPIADISGACGDRTKDCRMLTPQDVLNYDDNFPTGEASQARVCFFVPQYQFSVPGGGGDNARGAEACGNTGERADDFVGTMAAGGFGTDAPSWVHTLPGWRWGVIFAQWEMTDDYADTRSEEDQANLAAGQTIDPSPDGFVDDYFDDEKEFRTGVLMYAAVNPVVPKRQSTLSCIVPNILSEPDSSQLPTDLQEQGFEDPGIYGDYLADGIDVDVFPTTFRDQLVTARDATHDPVRHGPDGDGPIPGLAAVQSATGVDNAQKAASRLGELGGPETVEGPLPGQLDFTEQEDPEPAAEYHPSDYQDTDPTSINAAPFEDVVPKGLQCDASGDLVFNTEAKEVGGGLRFDVDINDTASNEVEDDVEGTVEIHVPTPDLRDPSQAQTEEESDNGVWISNLYTFNGQANAVLDRTGNERFDDCPGTNVQPGEDACPWEALWDAYNPACTNNANTPCRQLLEEKGYNASNGVGMHFVLKSTGPIVLLPEDFVSVGAQPVEADTVAERTVIGDPGDPTAQVCVVGTSTGFAPKLAGLVGADTGDDATLDDQEDLDALCGEDYDDDRAVIGDAFEDQTAVTPGQFDAGVSWGKILPTPAPVQEGTGFGADDELCVTGTWTVTDRTDDLDFANDTLGDPDDPGQENIRLEEGVHHFEDCDAFDTTGEPEQ